MKSLRRAYYDGFSGFYDRSVALQSRDSQGLAGKFPAGQVPVQSRGPVLDIGTGTAALLPRLRAKAG